MGTISQWFTQAYQLALSGFKKERLVKKVNKGHLGEQMAFEFLKARGLLLLERNYDSRWGEIDLVMNDKGTITFVEVRYRTKLTHGTPQETVNNAKAQKMIKTAHAYIKQQRLQGKPSRFDIVAIFAAADSHQIEWIKHAIEDTVKL